MREEKLTMTMTLTLEGRPSSYQNFFPHIPKRPVENFGQPKKSLENFAM